MACTPSSTTLCVLVIVSYWLVFFGAELLSTLRLYQKGNSIYHAMLNTSETRTHAVPNNTDHPMNVPLIMHRMWKDDRITDTDNPEQLALPVNWTKSFNFCTELYRRRNWTTVLWTDDSIRIFMEKYYPYFLPVYDSYPYGIQRADAARYFILYHYGGAYLDLDVSCQKDKDFTDFLRSMDQSEKVALLPLTQPFGFSNDVIFATKASPFFKELIDALPGTNRWYGLPYLTVLFSTGPMFLSLQYMMLSPTKQKSVLALPPELYTERGTRYFKHLRGSTWHQNDALVVQWMARNKKSLLAIALFLAVVCRKLKRAPQKHMNKRV